MTDTITVVQGANSTISVSNSSTSSVVTVTTEGPMGPIGPLRIATFYSGDLGADELLLRYIATDAFTLIPTRCTSTSDTAATANATFTLYKNGASVMTLKYAGGANTVTITGSNTAVANNDTLKLYAPPSADATLADVSFVFYGEHD